MKLQKRIMKLEETRPVAVSPGEGARKLKEFLDRIAERQGVAPDRMKATSAAPCRRSGETPTEYLARFLMERGV